ncbi:acetyl-CoA carboxylase, carboxyltransferase subunit beta [Shumkonia mesophila]|uniref:acetyl-CoA carboxylase, carboxyltransferase subunit beta n=1 Tax=Shumkonia mesophila TaxID=2838854 RepID=UPI0029352A04|nr:acetyl-CoA carboxylase, carboxyltransferase subunit beta [Shumkonia mesophila]
MNWLKNWVRPKLRELVGQREIPENLWHKCPKCEQMIFHRDLAANLRVCPHCGHHMRLSVTERLKMLFDDGAYQIIELPEAVNDPLRFRDSKRYAERLRDARSKNGTQDALSVAHGKMGGMNVVIAAFNFDFMGGSMGIAVGEGLLAAARLAVVQDAPLIVVPASGGARMQEGILSLMQMVRTTLAVEDVREAGLPYLVVLTDPTTGGVSASFAMLGDITVAEPGAVIGFAGARVIEQTIRAKLPEGFQRAEYLYDHGMVDIVVNRHELRATLIRIVDLLRNRRPPGELVTLGDAEEAAAPAKPARTAVAKAFAAKAKANKEKETSAE